VEEEEARGGKVGTGAAEAEGEGSGVGAGWCFLRSRQGLSSVSTSLRRRLVRGRTGTGGADADADAGSTISATMVSVSESTTPSGAAEAGRLMPAATPGSDACSDSLRCCCSGAGDDGGELRGDEAGWWLLCAGLGGALGSSRVVSGDEAAWEYVDGLACVSWSAISGSGLYVGSVGSTGGGAAEAGVSGGHPWGSAGAVSTHGAGNSVFEHECEIDDVNYKESTHLMLIEWPG
jgi:hypothetical protein